MTISNQREHLPIVKGISLGRVIELVNTFYLLDIEASDVKNFFTEITEEGAVIADLELHSGVTHRYYNKLTNQKENRKIKLLETGNELLNPVKLPNDIDWIIPPITLRYSEQVEFLRRIPEGYQDDPNRSAKDLSFKLRSFLRNNGNPRLEWLTGTMGDYCCAGFVMLAKGTPETISDKFKIDDSTEEAFIIQITTGKNKGLLCIQYQKP